MQRRSLLGALGALVVLAPVAARAEPVQDESWTDPARGRTLPMRLRWPDGDAPCAAVVHSHGLGGSRDGGDAWGRAWRDAGFLVLHVQHPGSDSDTLRQGALALRRAASAEQLVHRVGDMRFVLDEIGRRALGGAPWVRVRRDRIGAAGHSFGAQTVMAVAGKRYPVRAPELVEPRYRAFVALSPAPGRGSRLSLAQEFGTIERPFLAITGSLDGDPLGSELSPQDRARVYDGLPSGQRALLWLEGADHMTFGGNAERPIGARRGPFRREPQVAAREPEQQALVARITTAWWRAHLLDDAVAAAALRAPDGLAPGDRWRMD